MLILDFADIVRVILILYIAASLVGTVLILIRHFRSDRYWGKFLDILLLFLYLLTSVFMLIGLGYLSDERRELYQAIKPQAYMMLGDLIFIFISTVVVLAKSISGRAKLNK